MIIQTTTVPNSKVRNNKKYNLLHIGISFENNFEKIRYDYRAFCDEKEGCTYETTNIDRLNPREVFPNTDLFDNLESFDDIKKIKIYWGDTDKTFEEIREFTGCSESRPRRPTPSHQREMA